MSPSLLVYNVCLFKEIELKGKKKQVIHKYAKIQGYYYFNLQFIKSSHFKDPFVQILVKNV